MRSFVRITLLALVAGLLCACASKNPIDYLPQGKLYLTVNATKFQMEEGCKRLAEILKRFGQEDVAPQQAEMAYICLADFKPQTSFYLVTLTKPGAAKTILEQATKTAQAAPVKVAGYTGYKLTPQNQVGPTSRAPLVLLQFSDSALIGASSEQEIETMVRVARKKVPGALGTPEFTKCQQLAQTRPLAIVANVGQFTSAIPPTSLGPLAKSNPKAAEALQKIQMVSLCASWDQQPNIELLAYMPDEAAARDLAALFNFFLNMQRNQLPAVAQNLAAKPSGEGLSLSLEIPKAQADEWLTKLDQLAATLPQDPAKRSAALGQALPTLFR
jgi:hypothetical protein